MIRTEIDSLPAELDAIRRRIVQLEIEKEALTREKDEGSAKVNFKTTTKSEATLVSCK